MASYASLRDTEFRIYGEIVQLRAIANALQLEETVSLSDLETIVIGHRFRVAVVGEFNRGKSTAINALLGDEVLPASIEACSAALNRVTYGDRVTARVVMRGDGPPEARSETVPLDQLVEYVTKLSPDAARMAASIEEAVITYPSRFCRNNVDLIDTPGLNDEPTMTAVTMRALGRINAAVMVIRAAFSFSRSEQLLLEKLLSHDVTSILFLVTAVDELDDADRPRVVRETRNRILKALRQYADDVYEEGTEEYDEFLARFGEPQVYGVAALSALKAKRIGTTDRVDTTGYPAFEGALEQLLAGRDGTAAVMQTGRKLLKVCDQIARAIQNRRNQLTALATPEGRSDQHVVQIIDRLCVEVQQFGPELQRDADDALFRVQQVIEGHTESLRAAVLSLISEIQFQDRDVVAVAGKLWQDPARPANVHPNYRDWAIKIAQDANAHQAVKVEGLSGQIQKVMAVTWEEVVAGVVRNVYVETRALQERLETKRQTWQALWDDALREVAAEAKLEAPSLRGFGAPDNANLAAARSAIVQQLLASPPVVQVQPAMVALRAVTGVFSATRLNTEPDAFVHEFQTLCKRAVTASLETNLRQRNAQLDQLVDQMRVTLESVTAAHSAIIQELLTAKDQLISYLTRRQQQREAHALVTIQQLDQLAEQTSGITRATVELLESLERLDASS